MNTPGAGTVEVDFRSSSGYAALVVLFLLLIGIPLFVMWRQPILLVLDVLLFFFIAKGMYMLQPNQSALLMLFGDYRGTDYSTGLRWANPFMNKTKVSLRLRNFNSEKLKVNDKRGNPIEIAAAVVWRVSDTARAVLDIDHYEQYVPIQAEAALRHLANQYSYDHIDDEETLMTSRVRPLVCAGCLVALTALPGTAIAAAAQDQPSPPQQQPLRRRKRSSPLWRGANLCDACTLPNVLFSNPRSIRSSLSVCRTPATWAMT